MINIKLLSCQQTSIRNHFRKYLIKSVRKFITLSIHICFDATSARSLHVDFNFEFMQRQYTRTTRIVSQHA